ncbi:MAG TPA: sulfotransferase family 2 domain-containing protein, partial [Casimicrobiaceae bacterium]|nr:sulfotransferase family 2 domain-containing protein [Casimicrobiaceae bacterium]
MLHFLHIGKTGGTAIKHALRPIGPTRNLALHGHGTRFSDIPLGEQVFFFLRDPLSRFVSAFYSRQREGRPRYVVPWSHEEAAAFGRFHTPNELATGLSSSSGAERRKAERAMRNIAHVNANYWNWLVSPAYLQSRSGDIFFIGLQEQLASDFVTIRMRLGVSDDVQLPDDDVDAHRNPVSVDRTLSEAAAANLAAWYAADFAAMRECRRIAREQALERAIVTLGSQRFGKRRVSDGNRRRLGSVQRLVHRGVPSRRIPWLMRSGEAD